MKKKTTFLRKQLAIIILMVTNCYLAISQPRMQITTTPKPTLKEIWVLLPMLNDAQKIKVIQDSKGQYVYQGDMLIDTSQILRDTTFSTLGSRPVENRLKFMKLSRRRNITFLASPQSAIYGKWDGSIIPYKIAADMPDEFREIIQKGIDHINNNSNLIIRPKTEFNNDYVEFEVVRNEVYSGLASNLGKIGGRQTIKLDIEGETVASKRTVVHELLHTAGFMHEHARSDRNEFITYHPENVVDDYLAKAQFDVDNNSNNITEYDYKSVMHYFPKSFGKKDRNGNKMVVLESKDPDNPIDPGSSLSEKDIQGINSFYSHIDQRNDAADGNMDMAEGRYYIKCAEGGKYLDVDMDCINDNGCKVQLWRLGNRKSNNTFVIEKIAGATEGGYTIKCLHNGKFLDADNNNITKTYCKIQVWDRNMNVFDRKNQEWYIRKVKDSRNKYRIRNIKSGMYLDAVDDCVDENGCRLHQWQFAPHDKTQWWIFEPAN